MFEELSNLTKDVQEYIKVQFDLIRLHTAENISRILCKATNIVIIFHLILFIILFASLSSAFYLSSILKSYELGFLCVAVFYILLLIIFLIFRNLLVEKPMIKSVIKIIFPENNTENKIK